MFFDLDKLNERFSDKTSAISVRILKDLTFTEDVLQLITLIFASFKLGYLICPAQYHRLIAHNFWYSEP